MPKIVDHEARRAELLEATWRVIARAGIVGVTIREIAREAGVSTGILAHYFGSKEDLLASALRLSHRRVYERIAVRSEGVKGLEALRTIMIECLPLDDERLLEAQIEMNFMSLAVGNDSLRELQHEEFVRWWDALQERVVEAQQSGEIPSEVDPGQATHQLVILVEGLSLEAVLYPSRMQPAHEQLEILETVLAQLGANRSRARFDQDGARELPAGTAGPAV